MGGILLQNLLDEKAAKAAQIKVVKPSQKNKIAAVSYFKNTESLPKNYLADLVFLCLKPQGCEEILREFAAAETFHKDTIFVSILAGKKLEFFAEIFGKKAKIVRSMPNLPIQDSCGILSYFPNKNLSKSEVENLEKIFAKFGQILRLKNESLFDVATAIFGSGPAYIFLLQEIFAEIAAAHGINKSEARELVKTLFLGSALTSCNSELDFAALQESVTSKKGTTQKALDILQRNFALKNLFSNAIEAAATRSRELSDS